MRKAVLNPNTKYFIGTSLFSSVRCDAIVSTIDLFGA